MPELPKSPDLYIRTLPLLAALSLLSAPANAITTNAPQAPVAPEFRSEWIQSDENAVNRQLIYSGRFYSPDFVRQLYEQNSYRELWTSHRASPVWMDDLLSALDDLRWDALPRWRYHAENIRRLQSEPERGAVLDLMITDALVTAVRDLSGQLVPATALGNNWKLRAAPVDAVALIRQLQRSGQASGLLDALRPDHPQYARLREAYQYNLTREQPLTLSSQVILRSGDEGPAVGALMQRLESEGLLALSAIDRAYPLFDSRVDQAVREFQQARGLKADGIVGPATVRALNRSPESIARTIALNLQRWRTTPRDFPKTHVFVNSAAFEMSLIEDGKRTLSMPVVVGKRSRQTPTFADTMDQVILNPNWNIPTRIAREEILPKIRADRTYAQRIGLRALQGNRVIDWDEIDDELLNSPDFPYRLQQAGGDYNSLGRYKFMFPNKYLVYLHDTPYKYLFNRDVRAFSHGCVRLKEPDRLARHLLAKNGVHEGQVSRIVDSGERRAYALNEPLPIYLMYLTSWVRDDGQLELYPDNYRIDPTLDHALVAAGKDPGTAATLLALAEQIDPAGSL
ncbi:L,D-transpeptidase family protein [Granulosicoccaceae sp. 1_MG-2023]|nr:L,D-transpeptidase family protein [Granulosicoccaceae sp. 1_MG-2023]